MRPEREALADVRIEYDTAKDMAYLYRTPDAPRVVGESRVCEEIGNPIETIIDLNETGRVVGIEFRNAKQRLPENILLDAEAI